MGPWRSNTLSFYGKFQFAVRPQDVLATVKCDRTIHLATKCKKNTTTPSPQVTKSSELDLTLQQPPKTSRKQKMFSNCSVHCFRLVKTLCPQNNATVSLLSLGSCISHLCQPRPMDLLRFEGNPQLTCENQQRILDVDIL